MNTGRTTGTVVKNPKGQAARANRPPDGAVRSVAVCIPTYRRPASLDRLLQAIAQQRFESAPHPRVRVIVIDNSPDGEGVRVCEDVSPTFPFPLSWATEPEPGVSETRNRAVRSAREPQGLVAFIDDDSYPCETWLEQMLAVEGAHDADVVSGPVEPEFETTPPAWMVRGGFYSRPRMATGTETGPLRAGNILIRDSVFDSVAEPWFDPRMGLTGGEDFLFLSRAEAGGATMVWADEAVVFESVPSARVSVGWLLRRWYRLGTNASICERELRPGISTMLIRLVKLGVRMFASALALLVTWPSRIMRTRVLMSLALSAGMLSGLFNVGYREYDRKRTG